MAVRTPSFSTRPLPGGAQQVGQGGFRGFQGITDLLRLNVLDVLVGVIYHGVKTGR